MYFLFILELQQRRERINFNRSKSNIGFVQRAKTGNGCSRSKTPHGREMNPFKFIIDPGTVELTQRRLRWQQGRHWFAYLVNKNNYFCMRCTPRTCVFHFETFGWRPLWNNAKWPIWSPVKDVCTRRETFLFLSLNFLIRSCQINAWRVHSHFIFRTTWNNSFISQIMRTCVLERRPGCTSSLSKEGEGSQHCNNPGLVPEMVSRWRHATICNNVCI